MQLMMLKAEVCIVDLFPKIYNAVHQDQSKALKQKIGKGLNSNINLKIFWVLSKEVLHYAFILLFLFVDNIIQEMNESWLTTWLIGWFGVSGPIGYTQHSLSH